MQALVHLLDRTRLILLEPRDEIFQIETDDAAWVDASGTQCFDFCFEEFMLGGLGFDQAQLLHGRRQQGETERFVAARPAAAEHTRIEGRAGGHLATRKMGHNIVTHRSDFVEVLSVGLESRASHVLGA